jgi:two-component system response regulator PilR (NtrC family)
MMKKFSCLLVDDEPELLEMLIMDLQRNMGITCQSTDTLREAKSLLENKIYDLCITDMVLNAPDGREGLELVQHIQTHYPHIPTIVITAFGDMNSAIQAFRQGAFDYITKPLDFETLHDIIKKALCKPDVQEKPPELIGTSKPMQTLRARIQEIAHSEAAIYIYGESGSGKELAARSIHYYSTRNQKSFIPVNCGAIPEDLVESELFGHKKGSFTGAQLDRKGLFEEARGGTLFLDEVSELPLNMQVKLLRAIQEKAVRPVGSNKEITTDVRIISATHQNLFQLVKEGRFREDLYFRICVFELQVPPLRERISDIEQLSKAIIKRLRPGQHYKLTKAALTALKAYHYRGNVRELENMLEAAITICRNHTIKASDFTFLDPVDNIADIINSEVDDDLPQLSEDSITPISIDDVAPLLTLKNDKDKVQCQQLLIALQRTNWNKTQAAELLDMKWGRFRYCFDKYGLNNIKPH